MLLLVVGLGPVQRHGGHGADRPADLILAHGENSVVESGPPPAEGAERPAVHHDDHALRLIDPLHILRPLAPDQAQITAGDHRTLAVDHTYHTVAGFLELEHHILKNSSRHTFLLHRHSHPHFVQYANILYYYTLFFDTMQENFSFFHKIYVKFLTDM